MKREYGTEQHNVLRRNTCSKAHDLEIDLCDRILMKQEVLHSNFPIERQVNPTKFDHLMSEWNNALDEYFNNHPDVLIFDVYSISNDLNYPGLYTALTEYIGKHKLIFQQQLPYFCNSYWSYFKFVFCKQFKVEQRVDKMEGSLVYLQRLQNVSDLLDKQILHDRSSKLFNITDFKRLLSTFTIDVNFLFDYLQAAGTINVDKNAVKYSKDPIVASDHQILNVKNTLSTLQNRSVSLESDIQSLQSNIIANKLNKQKALSLLKKRKQYQSLLQQRQTTIQTLDDMLMKIDECETDKQIMDAYQHGSSVIKTTMKEYGLTVDKVHDTIAMVNEVLQDAENINIPNFTSDEIENEVELEFNEMLNDLEIKSEVKFPSIPSAPISDKNVLNTENPAIA
eukprot:NODE_70_length_23697_cov_0.294771.p7 type:complete len:395 gc:universal NODE_70_length_23697_cov_0.294771:11592-12776(+)